MQVMNKIKKSKTTNSGTLLAPGEVMVVGRQSNGNRCITNNPNCLFVQIFSFNGDGILKIK